MSQNASGYVNQRVLKINVGFLLNDGPGHSHNSRLDLPQTRVSDDVQVDYLNGALRLSRTKEGILVQAHLNAAVQAECYRCLTPTAHPITLDIEELYATQPESDSEFRIHEDGILDLSPLLRAEIVIVGMERVLCREECQGLCPTCGANLNTDSCRCDLDNVDPRLAALRQLLD